MTNTFGLILVWELEETADSLEIFKIRKRDVKESIKVIILCIQ